MVIRTQCKKCGATVILDFGSLTWEEALAAAERMDCTPRECPGRHVELSGFRQLWSLDDAIHRAYDLGEGEAPTPVMPDHEYLEKLLAEGKDIIDGGLNTVPELNLSRLHDFVGLDHMGFGNFKNNSHLFLRCDSPQGTRFYERLVRESALPATIPA